MPHLLTPQEVEQRVLADLTAAERQASVVYLSTAVQPGGTEARLGQTRHVVDVSTIIVFIDDEPAMNWGHRCRYRLYNAETGQARDISEQFPPPESAKHNYRLIWKPDSVGDWAIWTQK